MRDRFAILVALGLMLAGCGRGADAQESIEPDGEEGEAASDEEAPGPPPFAVSGNASGLLLVWFDAEGPHTATSRDDVPEAHRQQVRVDSLSLGPDERLDPAWVWVADLRAPGANGRYAVRTVRRAQFDALADRAAGVAAVAANAPENGGPEPVQQPPAAGGQPAAGVQPDVIIYGASWCGACRSAAGYLRSRNIPFVERDIEREPGAREEMQRKCAAAGVRPSGIPVIDVRGTILTGFDPGSIDRLLARPI